jgi:predicted MFS family arabinose efflux permease
LSAVVFTDGPRRAVRLDVAGLISFTAAAALITFAIIRAGEDGWTARTAVIAFVVGVLALATFVILQLRRADPLVDLSLLTHRTFTGATLAALLMPFAAFGSLALTSIWLQSVGGLTPLQTGLTLLPMSLAAFVVAAVTGRFSHRIPAERSIALGLALIGAGDLLMLVIQPDSTWRAFLAGSLVLGAGVGLAAPPLTSAALAAVPLERSGMASGVVNTARQLGLALGVAVLGTTFTSRAAETFSGAGVPNSTRIASAVSGGQRASVLEQAPAQYRPPLDAAIHQAFAHGLHSAFTLAGALGITAAVLCYAMLRNAPKPAWQQQNTQQPTTIEV